MKHWKIGGLMALSAATAIGCGSSPWKGADGCAEAPMAPQDRGGATVAYRAAPAKTEYYESKIADPEPRSSEQYTDYGVRSWVDAAKDARSTFSIDVDTGAYTVVRSKLRSGTLPPTAAVRVEELVNYFRQDYPDPKTGPFAVLSEAASSPFRPGKVILRVGLQGKRIDPAKRKRANLVFLVDTSGSMSAPNKLGLVKQSLRVLVGSLRADDRVAICTYAGSVQTILEPTPASDKRAILGALSRLRSGGGTAMGSGVALAYSLAARMAQPGTLSKVFVCSDGDANIGPMSHHQILETIARHKERGIFLGTVGYGMGNYKDTMMEQLADRGEGNYAYVDSLQEAERLFGEDVTASLTVLARDVKLQVAFDATRVARYRLLGYENRAILDQDFRNDHVDAGEIGAGHTVTALYELDLVTDSSGPLGTVSLRYKAAERPAKGEPDVASEETFGLTGAVSAFGQASQRFRFTACVGEFAEVLRKSPHVQTRLPNLVGQLEGALDKKHDDREHDLLGLVKQAALLITRS